LRKQGGGIISKRVDAPGDRGLWLKTKCLNHEEFIVVGFIDPEGSRPYFGALLLGYYGDDGRLLFAKVWYSLANFAIRTFHGNRAEVARALPLEGPGRPNIAEGSGTLAVNATHPSGTSANAPTGASVREPEHELLHWQEGDEAGRQRLSVRIIAGLASRDTEKLTLPRRDQCGHALAGRRGGRWRHTLACVGFRLASNISREKRAS